MNTSTLEKELKTWTIAAYQEIKTTVKPDVPTLVQAIEQRLPTFITTVVDLLPENERGFAKLVIPLFSSVLNVFITDTVESLI